MIKKKHGCGRCRMQVSKTPWQQRQTTRTRALFDEDEAEQDEQPPGTVGLFFYNLRQSFRDVGGLLAYKYFNWRKARETLFQSCCSSLKVRLQLSNLFTSSLSAADIAEYVAHTCSVSLRSPNVLSPTEP